MEDFPCYFIFTFISLVMLVSSFKLIFVSLLLLKHDDVEINPGPKKKRSKIFSCFHWNVNSILAHNKLSLLEA